jgi:hypothetical protein
MDNSYEIEFLKALLITISIETVLLFLLVKKVSFFKLAGISNLKIITVGILASLATLPYVWFIFPVFISVQTGYIITSESFAVITETIIFYIFFRSELKKSVLDIFYL